MIVLVVAFAVGWLCGLLMSAWLAFGQWSRGKGEWEPGEDSRWGGH